MLYSALLQHQKLRKCQLEEEMDRQSSLLQKLRAEVSQLETAKIERGYVNKSFPSVSCH